VATILDDGVSPLGNSYEDGVKRAARLSKKKNPIPLLAKVQPSSPQSRAISLLPADIQKMLRKNPVVGKRFFPQNEATSTILGGG